MRKSSLILSLILILLIPASAGATDPVAPGAGDRRGSDFLAKRNHITLDLSLAAAALGYARTARGNSFFGGEGGIGFEWLNYTPVAGEHFEKGYLHELVHLAGFWRYQPSGFWQSDVGVRTSLFIHDTGNASAAFFYGGYVSTYVGWRYVKFGPSVLIGVMTEGRSRSEFCVHVMPLSARLLMPW
jgi:hypothetical protein